MAVLTAAHYATDCHGGISHAALPTDLPGNGPPLQDWFQFESVVLAMRRTAHQFTVLLPTPAGVTDAAEHQRRLDLARRIVELEKPAHTVFDVKFYWSAFRVGAARLGDDTLIDVGSRVPALLRPMVLGQGYLVESYLAPEDPRRLAERRTVGTTQLLDGSTTREGTRP